MRASKEANLRRIALIFLNANPRFTSNANKQHVVATA